MNGKKKRRLPPSPFRVTGTHSFHFIANVVCNIIIARLRPYCQYELRNIVRVYKVTGGKSYVYIAILECVPDSRGAHSFHLPEIFRNEVINHD